MTTNVSAPTNFASIPDTLIALCADQGAHFSDEEREGLLCCWQNGSFLPHRFAPLRRLKQNEAPAARYPGWSAALLRLLDEEPQQTTEKAHFLANTLSYFLSAAELFACPTLNHTVSVAAHINLMPRCIPRNLEESRQLAVALQQCDDPDLAKQMLLILARLPGANPARETERDELLQEVFDTLPAAVFDFAPSRYDFQRSLAADIVKHLSNPDLLKALMLKGSQTLRRIAIDRAHELQQDEQDWSAYHDIARRYPDDFCEDDLFYIDLPLLEILWDSGTQQNRVRAVDLLFTWLEVAEEDPSEQPLHKNPAALVGLLQRFLDQDSACVAAVAEGEDEWDGKFSDLEPAALYRLWQPHHPALEPLFLPTLAYRLKENPYYDYDEDEDDDEDDDEDGNDDQTRLPELAVRLAKEVLNRYPRQLAKIKLTRLPPLLGYIDNQELATAADDILKPLAAKSKPVQRSLPDGLKHLAPAILDELGWLEDKRKGVRGVGLEALLCSEHDGAIEYLKRLLDNPRSSDIDKDRIRKRLGELGEDVAPAAAPAASGLDELKAKAAKAKIKTVQVNKLWNDELAALLQPLDDTCGRWLLSLGIESEKTGLPQLATDLLGHVPRENQAGFVDYMVQHWLGQNGERKLRWVLAFVPNYGDDRIVEPLFEAFKGWHKRAKAKAVVVIEVLGALDTAYALSYVHEIYTKNTYSYALYTAAKKALQAAAERRRVGLLDLFDELTPTLGLGPEGLVLDAGPRTYTVSVGTDLRLQVRNSETDRVTKSLPKMRADEDPGKRQAAESAYRLLQRSLKKVAKQQAGRLREALICNRRWPAARWRLLFVDHPLLGLLAQGLIWTRWNAAGQRLDSFRISEDRSLIRADDEPAVLADDDTISLWHPVEADEQELERWRGHFQDYELKPFLAQFTLPRLRLEAAELKGHEIGRFRGTKVEQFIAKRYLEGWNYEINDQDGSHIFGYQRRFPLLGVTVVVETEGMDAFSYAGASITLGEFGFYRGGHEKAALETLPPSLIATILGQGEALAAA